LAGSKRRNTNVSAETPFTSLTVQFYVPDIAAGVAFYSRALGRPPNFAPYPDFYEWDHVAPNVTFQVAEGRPVPTYPIRFGVADIEAEQQRVANGAQPAFSSGIKRFEGLVATCDFVDPWGNTFGFYQVLFSGQPPKLKGFGRDQRTEVEQRIADGQMGG
jgi:catechol 2,3-dioxygenase-like lactoylglutathione lyase family enzyme